LVVGLDDVVGSWCSKSVSKLDGRALGLRPEVLPVSTRIRFFDG